MSSRTSGIGNDADVRYRPTNGRQRYRPHKPKIQRKELDTFNEEVTPTSEPQQSRGKRVQAIDGKQRLTSDTRPDMSQGSGKAFIAAANAGTEPIRLASQGIGGPSSTATQRNLAVSSRQSGKKTIQALPGYENEGDQILGAHNTHISGKPSGDYIPSFRPIVDALDEDQQPVEVPENCFTPNAVVSADANGSNGLKSLFLRNVRSSVDAKEIHELFGRIGKIAYLHTGRKVDEGRVWVVVDFETVEEAKEAKCALDGEVTPICVGQKLRIKWSDVSALEYAFRDLEFKNKSQPMSQLMPFDPLKTSSNFAGHSMPGLTGANLLSTSARTSAIASSGTTSLSGNGPTFAPRTSPSGHFVPPRQQTKVMLSPVLSIDRISLALSSQQVTERLIAMLSPTYDFDPKPIELRFTNRDKDRHRYTMIRLANAAAARGAEHIINSGSLNGNGVPVNAQQIAEASPNSRYLQGLVRLDNVPASWSKENLRRRVEVDLRVGTLVILDETMPREHGTKSYLLEFDFPETARMRERFLNNRALGGPNLLMAAREPVR